MRSALVAALILAGASSIGLTSALAYAPRPEFRDFVTPITMADDDLGVAGVDISKAGQNKQSRMNYLNGLLQETQGNVRAHCGQILDGQDASSGVMAFCRGVMPGR
jgi:hypothetical protein